VFRIPRYHVAAGLLIAFAVFLSPQSSPVMASEPGWRDVPDLLKKEPGAQRQGEFLFATGMARVGSVRPDKAHELAKKKALLRALQIVHMAAACVELPAALSPDERLLFLRLFAPLAPATRLEGLTVIRQWETDQHHFATVAVPESNLEDVPCAFSDLPEAIGRYIDEGVVSETGLAFCLRHTPRYSRLNRPIRERTGRWYQAQGNDLLASCFLRQNHTKTTTNAAGALALQNRTIRAARLTAHAEHLAAKGNWEHALASLAQALDLVPTFSRSYLVLADYFDTVKARPEFAICAAEEAMQDGTRLAAALRRKVSSLEKLGDPEAQVFAYLLSQCNEGESPSRITGYPKAWKRELDRLSVFPTAYMTLASAGRATDTEDSPPSDRYSRAQALFAQAKSPEDVSRALHILFEALENEPSSAKTHNLVGACYRHLDQPSFALPFLWQALNLDPEYDYALANLGICCRMLGLKESAGFYFGHEAVKDSVAAWVRNAYSEHHQGNL
jgi:tetratricopeptide (TPR) repeat protein